MTRPHILKNDALEALALSPDFAGVLGPGAEMPLLAVDLAEASPDVLKALAHAPCPLIGVGATGPEDEKDAAATPCDCLVKDERELARLWANVAKAPLASMVLVQLIRTTYNLEPADALLMESFAYATVQRGAEFTDWRETSPPARPRRHSTDDCLLVSRERQTLSITMNSAATRNEIDRSMRDALCEAFQLAQTDKTIGSITLSANGDAFSVGGAVHEFGSVADPATAHWIRSLRLPAKYALQLSDKLRVRINGAAIGAGVEIAAFAGNLSASPRAWFQLPELKYGLIPGAGGTVSIARRIGRQQFIYLALSMKRLRAHEALSWGLVDAVEE
ncbi:MAG: enoyl-CoA hydratase/isomerase family protein [Pseudomonadota bacterium]